MGKLRAATVPVASLDPASVERMFALFEAYYVNTSFAHFERDLRAKHNVIVLRDRATGRIEGFSTLRDLEAEVDGRKVYGVFTGDTIIAPSFWGGSALTWAFFTYLVRGKLRHADAPYYWFLISKGYKTYLLLSRNFPTYWPRHDRKMPERETRIIAELAEEKYPGAYDRGVLRFARSEGRLKSGVAPIDTELLVHEDIRFFAEKNPGHARGDELCCLGRVDIGLWFKFLGRMFSKAMAPKSETELAAVRKLG